MKYLLVCNNFLSTWLEDVVKKSTRLVAIKVFGKL